MTTQATRSTFNDKIKQLQGRVKNLPSYRPTAANDSIFVEKLSIGVEYDNGEEGLFFTFNRQWDRVFSATTSQDHDGSKDHLVLRGEFGLAMAVKWLQHYGAETGMDSELPRLILCAQNVIDMIDKR